MIVVLSLNTALDRMLVVPRFHAGRVHVAKHQQLFAGGKGLNVARALRQLGEPARVVGFLGGVTAGFIEDGCLELGIDQRWVRTAREARTCVIVVDPDAQAQTVLNERGPRVSDSEVAELRAELERSTAPGDTLCISGSAPPGVPSTYYADVTRSMRERGVRVLADVAGENLRQLCEAGPWALTPNYDECTAAFATEKTPVEMARTLSRHTENALLTLGRDGVIGAGGSGMCWLRPPPVRTVNAVGSGDAFVAGFLAGVVRRLPFVEAIRLGVACGASNAAQLEPGVGTPAEIETLVAGVTVEAL